MNEIEYEGKTYVLKQDIESVIKERINKVAARATTAESALEEAHRRLEKAEKAMSSVDILNQQLAEMQTKLQTSENRFNRYQSISKHGLTDPDLVEAIEWSYERSQKNTTDKDKKTLSEWLDSIVDNPDTAPITIRPHLQALKMMDDTPSLSPESHTNITEMPPADTYSQLSSLEQVKAPRTNSKAMPTPESADFLDRALRDPEFYAQNRDKVVSAWKNRNKRQV
jgi:uncharacterized phage infection (PIP) family protein YhgE